LLFVFSKPIPSGVGFCNAPDCHPRDVEVRGDLAHGLTPGEKLSRRLTFAGSELALIGLQSRLGAFQLGWDKLSPEE
jgi:hypothetical protein